MKTIDERDITISRELAYAVIKYGERYSPYFQKLLEKYIKNEFPEIEDYGNEKFDEILITMSDLQIESILLKME